MSKIIANSGLFLAITMAGQIAASSAAYTELGDLPIIGAPKLVSERNGYRLYEVSIPVYAAETDLTPSGEIKLRASLPAGVLNPTGVKWSLCLTDKPYSVGGNSGITYAGKPKFELVETVGLPPSNEQIAKASALMNSYLERQKTGFKAA